MRNSSSSARWRSIACSWPILDLCSEVFWATNFREVKPARTRNQNASLKMLIPFTRFKFVTSPRISTGCVQAERNDISCIAEETGAAYQKDALSIICFGFNGTHRRIPDREISVRIRGGLGGIARIA